MKRGLARLWNRRPLTRTERCTLTACRPCSQAGRTWSVDRRHWHREWRQRMLSHALSSLITVALFATALAVAGMLRVPPAEAVIALFGAAFVASVVVALVAVRRWRARHAVVARLDPNTNLDDLPDDYGDGHGPVPGCCTDCDIALRLRAEAAPYREASR